MSLVSGILRTFFGPKRTPWIQLLDATIDPRDETTRVVVTLKHDPAAEWNRNLAGSPVFIDEAPVLILGEHRVPASGWKGSGDVGIDALAIYPPGFDTTGHVVWGEPFDFAFDVPLGLVSGRLDVRVHYVQRGSDRNSEAFPLYLP